jgi:hypothetical protein
MILVSHESWAKIKYSKSDEKFNFVLTGSSMTDMSYCLNKYIRKNGEGFSWNDVNLKNFPVPK